VTYYYDCAESSVYYYKKDGYCPYCLKRLHPIIGNEERDEVIKE